MTLQNESHLFAESSLKIGNFSIFKKKEEKKYLQSFLPSKNIDGRTKIFAQQSKQSSKIVNDKYNLMFGNYASFGCIHLIWTRPQLYEMYFYSGNFDASTLAKGSVFADGNFHCVFMSQYLFRTVWIPTPYYTSDPFQHLDNAFTVGKIHTSPSSSSSLQSFYNHVSLYNILPITFSDCLMIRGEDLREILLLNIFFCVYMRNNNKKKYL